jgi:hypothetical protein
VDFVLEQRLDGSPGAVLDLLLDRDFLAARGELPKIGASELLELTRGEGEARVRVRMQFTGHLSPAVTKVVDPSKLTWVDDARFVLASRGGRHEILPDNYADRLACSYDDLLHDDSGATRRVLSGMVEVRAFLVGGKVEGAIVSGLREYADAEAHSSTCGCAADRQRRNPVNRRRRSEFVTTNTEEKPIAAAAITGFRSPTAASGIAATL